MSRALLLDLGGTAFLSGSDLLGLLGEQEPAVREVTARRGPLGCRPDHEWDAMIRGEITERDYWARRCAEIGDALGRPWTMQEFMTTLHSMTGDVVRPQAAALVADALAAGVPVGALTNDLQAFHGDEAMAGDPFLGRLDVLVDGSVTGILKPDPRAYALAVDALGVPAGEVVFLDDMPWNVAGAAAAGMVALEVDLTDPGAAFDAARSALGLAVAP